MSKRLKAVWSGSLALLASLTAPYAQAQYAKPPDVYSMTETNAMFGPLVTVKISRDGNRIVNEQTAPPPSGDAKSTHTWSYYDLQTHKNFSTDLNYPTANCNAGTFTGDWGDPFEFSAGMMQDFVKMNPRQTGAGTLNGFSTKVMEGVSGSDRAKFWIEKTYGLVVKAQLGDKTMFEVKSLSLAKPSASLFAIPATCGPAPPTEQEKISAVTGGNGKDFVSAIMAPSASSLSSCSVLFRVVRAGTMQPVTAGFQVRIDVPTGNLRDVTAQLRNGILRIDNAPAVFNMEASFGDGGDAFAQIYRNCISPQTVLLLVIKNPAKSTDGTDWLWVKSGKFAAGN